MDSLVRRGIGAIVALVLTLVMTMSWSVAPRSDADMEAATVERCRHVQRLEPQIFGIKKRLRKDDGKRRELRALVLLDGVSQQRAGDLIASATEAYRRLKILLAAMYRPVTLTVPANETDPRAFIDEARRLVGGARPSGVDVVHLLTMRNIAGAGYASCVGGVEFDTRSFSVSEELIDRPPELSRGRPIPWPWGDTTALTMAHEIGHLMGGEHLLANCVEGLLSPLEDLPRPCTLMDPSFAMAMRFSTANAAVVRGYAATFLKRVG